jgi:cupin superfamily acireductone dioxygenase involved in methionine salvage
MLYSKLAEIYEKVSSTTKRLEKIEIISKFLEYLPEKDKEVLYLLNGNIYQQ